MNSQPMQNWCQNVTFYTWFHTSYVLPTLCYFVATVQYAVITLTVLDLPSVLTQYFFSSLQLISRLTQLVLSSTCPEVSDKLQAKHHVTMHLF